MKIKVCGMRNAQNIQELSQLDVDFIGFICYDKSKRYVATFPNISIPSSIMKTGVFVNESIDKIVEQGKENKLQAVQLHGNESENYCKILKDRCNDEFEIIKAFSVDDHFNFSETEEYEAHCDLFVFDTKGKNYGGNGVKYDWNILKKYTGETPFLISGGITPNDVDAILNFHHEKCLGLDLNSGFEDEPALKNIEKLKKFIKEVKV